MDGFGRKAEGIRLAGGRTSGRMFRAATLLAALVVFPASLQAQEGETVAVLPFQVHAVKPLEHLRQGLQEMLNARLQHRGLKTVSPAEVNRLPDALRPRLEPADLRRIGGALGAPWVISGSPTQIGDKGSLDLQALKVTETARPPFFLFMTAEDLDALGDTIERVAVSLYNEITGAVQVESVRVKGNLRVESEAILSAVRTAKGDVLDYQRLDEDLREIYKMGYFTDVKIETEAGPRGKVVIFNVTEKPSIGKIEFDGNKKLKDDELQAEVGLKRYAILDRNAVRQGTNRLRDFYHQKGYYNVEIEEQIESLPNNEMLVKYVIQEHGKVYITRIEFLGNERFEDDKLRGLMETSEKGFFSWVTKSGLLDKKKLEFDIQKVAAFYHNHGYIRAVVGEPIISHDPDKGLKISIEVQEGREYGVNQVRVEGDLIQPADELLERVKITKQKVFNREIVRQDIVTLKDLYADEGYAYAEVTPQVAEDDPNSLVDITYTISRKEKVRFERINIAGNTSTRDKVVRRELKVVEGDYFSGRDLKKSAENLHRLGFFEDVQVQTRKGSEEDLMVLDISLKERPTGSFSMGAGYSSVEKTFTVLELSQNNFLGHGQKVSASARLGEISSEFDLKFVEPWLFDMPIAAGVDLYRLEEEEVDEEYSKESFGSALRFGFPLGLGEYTTGSVRYAYDDTDVRDVADDAAVELRDMEGRNVTSSTTLGISRDSRDRPWNTTRGSVNSLTFEYAGGFMGGDVAFNKYNLRTSWYFPLFWDTVFLAQGRWGLVEGRDDGKLPVYHKFKLGGINTMRGFDYRSISPVDPVSGDKIGGEKMMVYNLEYRFPLLKEQGVIGLVFFDAGNVLTDDESWTFSDIRKSVGGGIRYYSPIGPLRLEYGLVLDRRSGEPSGNWEFTVGGLF